MENKKIEDIIFDARNDDIHSVLFDRYYKLKGDITKEFLKSFVLSTDEIVSKIHEYRSICALIKANYGKKT